MFFRLIVLSLFAAVLSFPFSSDLDNAWQEFKRKFCKSYKNGEEGARRLIWEQALSRIYRHNLEADMGKHSFWLGMNYYSDMSGKEFNAAVNGYKPENETTAGHSVFLSPFNYELPDEVDWRKEGLVTEVKDQGICGSCWAFSSTGALEGQHKKKTGNLVELSEQNLIDCTWKEGDHGCMGGWMGMAFEYVQINGGIDTEKSYPYEAEDDKCRFKKSAIGATCTGQVNIPQGDEHALQIAVATVGPVSVAINASLDSFQYYRHGVYNDPLCSPTIIDHGVLIVGYGSQNGEDYWIVKNSWGKSWGDNGYILMARNKNQCGIANAAVYPLV